MIFKSEAEFETAFIAELQKKGWEDEIIHRPTEADLLANWAVILFDNNRGRDRLNDVPLTSTEMDQIIEQIIELKTPLKLNGFINGRTVAITRDNPDDPLHVGKEVSLKVYDRHEIAAGQSRYQIVQQPQFAKKSKIMRDRRGDVMLLINGMPVIHVELKRSGIPVSKAYGQIEKYSAEGMFTGLFSLVQVFVAMEPAETIYFANAGTDGTFNHAFYFHWADFNNEPVNDWRGICTSLLSIPMAHQLIGFYTVADKSDGVLKVMRSYQYHAANAISDKLSRTNWADQNRLGGYVWHTTGSGKTMTSFKSAQLIAQSKDADKVVFLVDRIELGVQSVREYAGFASDDEDVQATENTHALITKLKSSATADTLIVTSIQKMSNITEEDGLQSHDIERINEKRIVFIVDEAHRSTFGDMMIDIKETFPSAIFFGFTGTPIQDENQKKDSTTATVFGDELHRYSIADGIRDKNVLGFDPYKVMTYRDKDLRRAVALEKAKANSEAEALSDSDKKEVFNRYMRDVGMAGHNDEMGNYIRGIEDFLPRSQYDRDAHKSKVVEDIVDNWMTLSQNSKFHAIFATSGIPDAIEYYRRLKAAAPDLKVTALFDPNIAEGEGALGKQDGLIEILTYYNAKYGQDFDLGSHGKFKKDVAARLAHKKPYERIGATTEQQIDLLIVVDQMLTGFDSKYLNTLYLDKILRFENIIQAFSRTNRLYNENEKPFGTIRYYRKPHTMERNINDAVKLYSGDKPVELFVDKLETNLKKLNETYAEIHALFERAGVSDFVILPKDIADRGMFAKLFRSLNDYLDAARIQGFNWNQKEYSFDDGATKASLDFDENVYLILCLRYKELSSDGVGGVGGGNVPFDIDGHLTEIDTGRIDADYMNARFEKYLRALGQDDFDKEQLQGLVDELHKSFASLTQDEQKYANIFLNDLKRGSVALEDGKTFRDYVTEYQYNAKNSEILAIVKKLGVDEDKLNQLMNTGVTEKNLNEFGRFDALKDSVDKALAKAYFERTEGVEISNFQINVKASNLLRDFILQGGFEISS